MMDISEIMNKKVCKIMKKIKRKTDFIKGFFYSKGITSIFRHGVSLESLFNPL